MLRVAPENLAAIRALADIHGRRGDIPESVPDEVIEDPALPEPPVRVPLSSMTPVAVESESVTSFPDSGLAELESLLAAIQRARRDVLIQAAR